MSIALALLSAILGGAADFSGGMATKKLPVMIVVSASQLMAAIIMLLALAVARPALGDPSEVLWAATSGLFMVAGIVSFYAALALGTMSVVAPISGLGVLIPLSWGIAGEGFPSSTQIAAICLAVSGAILAGGSELKGRAGAQPIVLACASAVGFGGAMATLSEASDRSPLMAVAVMKLTICVLAIPIALIALRRTRAPLGMGIAPHLSSFLLIAILDVGATVSQSLAFQGGPVAIVSVVAALYPVTTILLARWLLTERLIWRQSLGVVLAMTGLAILAGH